MMGRDWNEERKKKHGEKMKAYWGRRREVKKEIASESTETTLGISG